MSFLRAHACPFFCVTVTHIVDGGEEEAVVELGHAKGAVLPWPEAPYCD